MSFSRSGRQLDRITKSDGAVVSFTYDANGMRTGKTVGTETFGHVWQDGKLVAEFYGNSEILPEGSTYDPYYTQKNTGDGSVCSC